MSIRSEAMSLRGELSPQLRELLRKNGMKAQLAVELGQYKLLVQGHDSPLLTYTISEQQFRLLGDGGTNYANKKAYQTFNAIVGKDFDLPSSYVAARNVNGRVSMGLHGYRVGVGETGYPRPHAFGRDFLGWTPRQQDGFHLRRVGGVAMMPTIVAEHPDGRMRPGELQSGGYGYYYKGQSQQVATDPLQDLQSYFPQVQSRPRTQEPAKPYKELITSDVYFTNEKWQEVLSSHGILVDAEKKTLTIQSSGAQQDFVYDLTDEEVRKLTDNSLKSVPLQQRIDVLNNVINGDFKDKISYDMLNSTERVAITLRPEVEASLQQKEAESQAVQVMQDPLAGHSQHVAPTLNPDEGYVNGADLDAMDERKGWYREGKHGREVEVGDIWVEKAEKPDRPSKQESEDERFTYKMSAVINGEVITHEISRKQYDKFMAVDDYQRQRMMSKIFHEVDVKTRPEMRQGFNLGAFLGAGLTAISDATYMGADIAHNIEHIKHPHPSPEVYQERHGTGRIYVKPGVDSPQDIAARAFEAGLNQGSQGHGLGR